MNSMICRNENGEYMADDTGLPSCLAGSPADGSTTLDVATRSLHPSLIKVASNTSTRVSSAKKHSKRRAVIAAASPKTKKVAFRKASCLPWNMARNATWGRYVQRKRFVRTKADSRTHGRSRARKRG